MTRLPSRSARHRRGAEVRAVIVRLAGTLAALVRRGRTYAATTGPADADEQDIAGADTVEIQRITAYANGARRVALVSAADEHDADAWNRSVWLLDALLDGVLLRTDLAGQLRGRDLRAWNGHAYGRRVQGWEIPAPHGPAVLDELAGHLAVLNRPSTRFHVTADH